MNNDPITRKGAATRQALLDAARQIFASKGFLNAEIGEVAELAGKSRATFYNYMGSKTELLLALIADFRSDDLRLASVDGAILVRERRAILLAMWDIYRRHAATLDALAEAAAVDPVFAAEQRENTRRGVENCQLLFRYLQENDRCLQFDADMAGFMLATMINANIQHIVSHKNAGDLNAIDEEIIFENLIKMVEAIIFSSAPAGAAPAEATRKAFSGLELETP